MPWISDLVPLPLILFALPGDAIVASFDDTCLREFLSILKNIATYCLAAVLVPSFASAQQTLPGNDLPPPGVDGQAPARSSKLPAMIDSVYVGGSLGPVFYEDNSIDAFDLDYETGGQITAFGGVRIGALRIEAEIGSQGTEFDPSNSAFDGDIDIFRATANLYLDLGTFPVGLVKTITPYVGGGVGVAAVDIEGFEDDTSAFTFHGEVGASFPIWRNIDLVPAYRYERSDFDDFDDDQVGHVVRMGARYNF